MRHTYETHAEYHTCDCCGVKLMDGELERSHIGMTICVDHEVEFEWWDKGEYCYQCRDALFGAICDAMPVPERCDKQFRDDDIEKAIEVAIIRRKRGIEVGE